MLPFEIESVESARARYAGALHTIQPVWQMLRRLLNEQPANQVVRPGADRRNVFDLEPGVRLIVSRDQIAPGPGGVVLHVSASLFVGSALHKEMRGWFSADPACGEPTREKILNTFSARAMALFREISGDDGPLEFLGYSPALVAHWCRKEAVDVPAGR